MGRARSSSLPSIFSVSSLLLPRHIPIAGEGLDVGGRESPLPVIAEEKQLEVVEGKGSLEVSGWFH